MEALYYAALRPAEAVALREADCVLPARGWGRIDLASSEPRAGTEWTDNGASREERGLKHRAVNETRSIPIPPALVRILRAHIHRYGTGPDGRLFRTARGGPLNDTGYGEVWQRARPKALTPAQQASPLARRPYDLRHAAVSLWLNAGVPATEVARRPRRRRPAQGLRQLHRRPGRHRQRAHQRRPRRERQRRHMTPGAEYLSGALGGTTTT
jgi:integrase